MFNLLRRILYLFIRLFARIAWPLGRKISTILIFLMLVVLLMCTVFIYLLFNLGDNNQARSEAANRVQAAELINQYLTSELDLYSDAVLVSQRTTVNDTFSNRLNTALIDFSRVEFPNTTSGNRIKSYLADLLRLYPKFGDVLGQINSLLSNRQFREAVTLYQSSGAFFTQIKDLTSGLKQETSAEQQRLDQNVSETINFSITIAFVLAGFTLVAILAGSFFLTYALSKAIRPLKEGMDKVANGDLNVVIQTEHRDEIGEVVSVINRALELLRQVIASSAIGQEVRKLSEDLAAASNQQASLAQSQAYAVSQSSSAMVELSQTVRGILNSSFDVAEAANSALSEAEEVRQGASEVDTSSTSVHSAVAHSRLLTNQMSGRFEALALQLSELASQSQEVAEVTSFIDEVARQTHILSINAAIEAAGALESGERFGVVANQVKDLARQIGGSITKIRDLLEGTKQNIQAASSNAEMLLQEVGQLHSAENVVTKGLNELIGNARSAVHKSERIVMVTHKSVELTHQIQEAIKNHEIASSQIVSSLIEIKDAAETNNQTSKALQANSSHLEQLSGQLTTALNKVRLA